MLNLLLFSIAYILFILHINLFTWLHYPINLLLELTSYFVYSAHFLCFKVFIIKRIQLVSINVIIDKPVLYSWHYY